MSYQVIQAAEMAAASAVARRLNQIEKWANLGRDAAELAAQTPSEAQGIVEAFETTLFGARKAGEISEHVPAPAMEALFTRAKRLGLELEHPQFCARQPEFTPIIIGERNPNGRQRTHSDIGLEEARIQIANAHNGYETRRTIHETTSAYIKTLRAEVLERTNEKQPLVSDQPALFGEVIEAVKRGDAVAAVDKTDELLGSIASDALRAAHRNAIVQAANAALDRTSLPVQQNALAHTIVERDWAAGGKLAGKVSEEIRAGIYEKLHAMVQRDRPRAAEATAKIDVQPHLDVAFALFSRELSPSRTAQTGLNAATASIPADQALKLAV